MSEREEKELWKVIESHDLKAVKRILETGIVPNEYGETRGSDEEAGNDVIRQSRRDDIKQYG